MSHTVDCRQADVKMATNAASMLEPARSNCGRRSEEEQRILVDAVDGILNSPEFRDQKGLMPAGYPDCGTRYDGGIT